MDNEKLLDEIAGLNSENDLLRKLFADAEMERTKLKVELEYAIADIPHTCEFCESNKFDFVCDCEGCENGSHWHWYGVMGG